jgi:hypothetical protein
MTDDARPAKAVGAWLGGTLAYLGAWGTEAVRPYYDPLAAVWTIQPGETTMGWYGLLLYAAAGAVGGGFVGSWLGHRPLGRGWGWVSLAIAVAGWLLIGWAEWTVADSVPRPLDAPR